MSEINTCYIKWPSIYPRTRPGFYLTSFRSESHEFDRSCYKFTITSHVLEWKYTETLLSLVYYVLHEQGRAYFNALHILRLLNALIIHISERDDTNKIDYSPILHDNFKTQTIHFVWCSFSEINRWPFILILYICPNTIFLLIHVSPIGNIRISRFTFSFMVALHKCFKKLKIHYLWCTMLR